MLEKCAVFCIKFNLDKANALSLCIYWIQNGFIKVFWFLSALTKDEGNDEFISHCS